MSGLASVLPTVGEPEGYGVCLWSRAGGTEEFGIVSFRAWIPISPGYSGYWMPCAQPSACLTLGVFAFPSWASHLLLKGALPLSCQLLRTSHRSAPSDGNPFHDWSWVPGTLETELTQEPAGKKGRSNPWVTKPDGFLSLARCCGGSWAHLPSWKSELICIVSDRSLYGLLVPDACTLPSS